MNMISPGLLAATAIIAIYSLVGAWIGAIGLNRATCLNGRHRSEPPALRFAQLTACLRPSGKSFTAPPETAARMRQRDQRMDRLHHEDLRSGSRLVGGEGPLQAQNQGWIIPQDFEAYSAAEHRTWTALYERQGAILPGRACDEFLHGLDALDLGDGIPDFERLNARLVKLTGWRVVAVPGLVPDEVFFDHLAHRRFPASTFIRGADQLDYLQEPDVFHDVFGHVPLLADPVFADYMQAYGKGGLRAAEMRRLHNLARLYWYTVEFGLVQTQSGLRIYGAGILSSAAESVYALLSPAARRIGFDLERVMRTPYRIDDLQQLYFVIPSLRSLLDTTLNTDFSPLYQRLAGLADIPIPAFEPGDKTFGPAHAEQTEPEPEA
jgi:phenylalanine-4-hydroxylase